MSINFKNLSNKRTIVIGLGLLGGGVEVVKWLVKHGAKVLVTDLKTPKELKESLEKLRGLKIEYVLGKHRIEDFKNADLIIKNPGVPKNSKYLKIAREHKIPIESDLSIFFRLFKGKIIGVTGTKGKSSTVNLLFQIMRIAKQKVFLGGNIGQSPLKYLDDKLFNRLNAYMILELSSWQLEDLNHLKKSPQIACVTTLFPDHLNTYHNFREYLEAKKIIFKYQNKRDVLILNADDKIVKNLAHQAKGRVIYFSSKNPSNKNQLLNLKTKVLSSNLLASTTIASALKISPSIIDKALRNFHGLANRLEFIKKVKSVDFYNDSASTVPQATILALKTLAKPEKTILISGGADKELDFRKFAQSVKKCKAVILFPGTATAKIEKALKKVKYFKISKIKTMKEAIKITLRIVEQGDIVLLSPGCASFGVFKNAYDRARQFISEVKKI